MTLMAMSVHQNAGHQSTQYVLAPSLKSMPVVYYNQIFLRMSVLFHSCLMLKYTCGQTAL